MANRVSKHIRQITDSGVTYYNNDVKSLILQYRNISEVLDDSVIEEQTFNAALEFVNDNFMEHIVKKSTLKFVSEEIQVDDSYNLIIDIGNITQITNFKIDDTEIDLSSYTIFYNSTNTNIMLDNTVAIGRYSKITFDAVAGYDDWASIPSDLQQGIIYIQSKYYENRESTQQNNEMAMGLKAILNKYTNYYA